MAAETPKTLADPELLEMEQSRRWRTWMLRIEAVLFASATPKSREELARVVGQGVSVDLLIEDLRAELTDRPYDVVAVAGGWMFRTRPGYADAIHEAADAGVQDMSFGEFDIAVLAAIAYQQPITRNGLKEIFGKEISRDLIGRLHDRNLITTGPRSPRPGAPYTFVTTDEFLAAFDLQNLRDLPDHEQLQDAGIISEE